MDGAAGLMLTNEKRLTTVEPSQLVTATEAVCAGEAGRLSASPLTYGSIHVRRL